MGGGVLVWRFGGLELLLCFLCSHRHHYRLLNFGVNLKIQGLQVLFLSLEQKCGLRIGELLGIYASVTGRMGNCILLKIWRRRWRIDRIRMRCKLVSGQPDG